MLVLSIAAVLLTPATLARYGRRAVLAEWRANRSRIILVGLASFGSYMLVLWAYTLARVSLLGAMRISVVFGALAGLALAWRRLRRLARRRRDLDLPRHPGDHHGRLGRY